MYSAQPCNPVQTFRNSAPESFATSPERLSEGVQSTISEAAHLTPYSTKYRFARASCLNFSSRIV